MENGRAFEEKSCPTPFLESGRWFKGNIHTHTSRSDGLMDPAAVAQWYRNQGYDFIVITDHRKIPEPEDLVSSDDFLIISGNELNINDRVTQQGYDVVCIGVDEPISLEEPMTIQELLDVASKKAGLAYIAHPYWHGQDWHDLLALNGLTGIEIYNATCETGRGKGYALPYWDSLLSHGALVWGYVADDAHWKSPDHGRAWVNVKAEELSRDAIVSALRNGYFYGSTGPSIEHVAFEGNQIHVKTSPVQRILIVGGTYRGQPVYSADGQPITEANIQFKTDGNMITDYYLRVQAVDFEGRSAWSNPLMFTGLRTGKLR